MELEKEESGISFWPRRFSDHNNNINTDDVVSNYKNNEKKIKQNLDLNLDPQNCFQVREIPGKGLGCVATRGIEPGELVVQDYPILTLEHDYKFKEWLAQGKSVQQRDRLLILHVILPLLLILPIVYLLPQIGFLFLLLWRHILDHVRNIISLLGFEKSCEDLYQSYLSLDWSGREKIEHLATVFPSPGLKERIVGIFCTNSFIIQENVSGVFPNLSRFNHSCRSNCSFTGEEENGIFVIRVNCVLRVEKDEELTLCYLDTLEEEAPCLAQERRTYLNWAYRFECKCEECSLPSYLRNIEDRRRVRLSKLRREWRTSCNLEKDWTNIQEQIMLLIRLKSCGKVEHLVSTLELAWETLAELNGVAGARFKVKVAELGVDWSRILYSDQHPVSQEWQARYKAVRKPDIDQLREKGVKKKTCNRKREVF